MRAGSVYEGDSAWAIRGLGLAAGLGARGFEEVLLVGLVVESVAVSCPGRLSTVPTGASEPIAVRKSLISLTSMGWEVTANSFPLRSF